MSGIINQVGARSGIISSGGSASAGTVTLSGTTGLDYEEGIWTPAFGSNALSGTLSGIYTKIGQLVFMQYGLDGLDQTGGSVVITLEGLPFPQGSGHDTWFGGINHYKYNCHGTGDLIWKCNNAASVLSLVESVDNAAAYVVLETDFSTVSASYLRGQFTYRYS